MAITIDDHDIFGRSTSLLPEVPVPDPVADDPRDLLARLLDLRGRFGMFDAIPVSQIDALTAATDSHPRATNPGLADATDPLIVALLDADDTYRRAAEFEHSEKEDAARDAAISRLSDVLAAARAIVANRERSTPQAIVALLVPNLADALAAADAAR